MGRNCEECGDWCERYDFSKNQWSKGVGLSRCKSCVSGVSWFRCAECSRDFSSQNALNMHMQVHRARNVSCPICGETRFRSGANAVQHVESGYCSGCRGSENARQQIYKFASSRNAMRPFMSSVPQLTYDDSQDDYVPDRPYQCQECVKSFHQLSQLLQHQDAKHSRTRLLGYY